MSVSLCLNNYDYKLYKLATYFSFFYTLCINVGMIWQRRVRELQLTVDRLATRYKKKNSQAEFSRRCEELRRHRARPHAQSINDNQIEDEKLNK